MALRAKLDELIVERRLGGSLVLRELAVLVAPYRRENDLSKRAVAYAMYRFLRASEYDHDERSYGAKENNTFIERSSSLLLEAAKFLEQGGSHAAAVAIVAAISDLEMDLLPL